MEEIWLVCVAELLNRGGKRIGRDVWCVFADARFSKEGYRYLYNNHPAEGDSFGVLKKEDGSRSRGNRIACIRFGWS